MEKIYKTGGNRFLRSETLTVQAKKDGVIYRLEYRGIIRRPIRFQE
jgi:hypothetical protein